MFLADTNIYIAAANEAASRESLGAFLARRGPIAVSAVVAAEVLLGIADASQHAAAVTALLGSEPLLAPTPDDWLAAASALARLHAAPLKTRSFWNDALLAAQCGRLGATLVTRNEADFRRLRRVMRFTFVPPFPA